MIELPDYPQLQTGANNLRLESVSPGSQLLDRCLTLVPALFIACGVVLRTRALLFNAPFYQDEASLAQNIEDRPLLQLFRPLDGDQAAPPGFLVLQKLAHALFGSTEIAYRLLPFVSSLIVLWLTWLLARRLLDRWGATAACAIVSLSWPMVYFSTDNKQYETEALVACALLFLWTRFDATPGPIAHASVLSCVVSYILAPWFSYSAPFVIAAIETSLLVRHLGERSGRFLVRRLPIYLCVIASCGVLYFVLIRETQKDSFLQSFWADAYAPFPVRSYKDVLWFMSNFYRMFLHPIGFPDQGVAPLLFLVGCAVLWRKCNWKFWALPGILLWVLLASSLKQYPFGDRLLLFAVVPMALTIGLGVSSVASWAWEKTAGPASVIALCALLLVPISLAAASHLVRPTTMQDFRAAFSYINEHRQPDDEIVTQHEFYGVIEWYRGRHNGMPLSGLLHSRVFPRSIPITPEPPWKNCDDIRRMLTLRRSAGRTWILVDRSEWSQLFEFCTAGMGAKEVLSTRDEGLFLYTSSP